MGRLTTCVVGLKGAVFLEKLLAAGISPSRVVTYEQRDDVSESMSKIVALAASAGIQAELEKHPDLETEDLTLLVGWQYLIQRPGQSVVVFHDSLLPRYRGFAPTVTALINGDAQIGVTALQPSEEADRGAIFEQLSMPVRYPMAIADALEAQASLMVELAIRVYSKWHSGSLDTTPQDEQRASYSIWRDENDYLIDWNQSAEFIERFVYSVGYPYGGARTRIGERDIVVDRASVAADLHFEIRQPGKIWRLDDGMPLIVCGEGLLRLDACRTLGGGNYNFSRIRSRLG
jgi:methionyl-tRNA formyltransferase